MMQVGRMSAREKIEGLLRVGSGRSERGVGFDVAFRSMPCRMGGRDLWIILALKIALRPGVKLASARYAKAR